MFRSCWPNNQWTAGHTPSHSARGRYVVKAASDRSLAMCLLKPSSLLQCVFAMRLRLPNVSSQFVFAYLMCLRNASAPPSARTRACSSVLERTRAYSSVLERTRAYSSILERTRAYSSVLESTRAYSSVLVRTRAYSSVLERTRAYSSVLERTRAYARVLEVQSPIAAAMNIGALIIRIGFSGSCGQKSEASTAEDVLCIFQSSSFTLSSAS